MINETLHWLDQAEHHAEEASNHFRSFRPRSGADEMSKAVAIIEAALPIAIFIGKQDMAQVATSWIRRVTDCLLALDWLAIADELKYERAFIGKIRDAVETHPDTLLELDRVLTSCRE